MLKKVVLVAAVLVVIGVVAVRFLGPEVDRRVAGLIERYGGAATGTEVEVGGVDIALTQGRGTIDRLTIGNPEGFETEYAVRIENVGVALDVGSVASDVPVVTEVLLNGVHINAEQRGDATNLTEIQEAASGSGGAPEPGAEEGRIKILLFRATDARLTVTSELAGGSETVDLEDVVVRDIGGTQGATYSEAAAAMLEPVIDAAVAAVRGRLQDAVEDAAREEVDEEVQELQQEAEGRIRDLLDR